MLKMEEEGFSTKEISQYLNENGYVTPRGRSYYPSLVWVTLKKLKSREKRKKDTHIKVSPIEFWLYSNI